MILEEIRFCIFAVGALEAFVNQMITATFTYTDNGKTFSKKDIERCWSLEDKFKKIIPLIAGVRVVDDTKKWCIVTLLIGLRNDLIHLKTAYPVVSDFQSYQVLYRRLLDNNYAECFDVVKAIISSIASPTPSVSGGNGPLH